MAIIGIDLGTTNSLGSVYRNGSVELIPNAYNSFITPSVVAIKPDGQVLVGAPAKKYQLECPENATSLFKRKMGSKDRIKVGDKHLLPEELSSLVIGSIIADAERFLGEKVEEAVISVPAYFYDDQRYATKKAGTLAGVKVDRIVNEPSAAALANYYHEGKEKHLLIFDFGGGTLDVSVVDCLGNVIGIESIAGDNVLGGSDFDVLIADSFCKEHKLTDLSELEKEALITVSEQCKKRLTDSKETELVFVMGENKYTSHYTLKRLATESEDILKKIRSVVNHALQDAGLRIDEIEEIIMVGGSSKMPLVQSYMQFLFQKVPVVTSNCDEQVAIGVGAFCGIKTKSDGIKQYSLSDVCPFSLSVNNFNKHNPERPYSDVLIPRNSMLPCSYENEYSTVVDKQTKLKIGVYQGESMYADDNKELDTIRVTVPARSAGEETVKVRFTYDVNGLLIVDVTKKDGEHIRKLISQNLSDEEIEKSMFNMEKLIVHPKDTQENKDLLERLEKSIAESTGDLREYFMGMAFYFEELLDGQNVWRIAKVRDAMGKELDDYSKWRNNSLADNIEVSTFLNEYEKDLSADEAWGEDEAAYDENSPEEWEEFKKWIN